MIVKMRSGLKATICERWATS